jgi:hypothetical protein
MNTTELLPALSAIASPQKYLQREIAVLSRKKVTKLDPYRALHTVLMHLYCIRDVKRFRMIFDQFIAAEMDFHFTQDFDLWSWVEGLILLESDLTGDLRHAQRIWDKGFVPDRLDGSLLQLQSRNLKTELAEFDKGHQLPKATILHRYASLIEECLLMIHFKKGGSVGSQKNTRAHLERYRQLYVAGVDAFRLKDEQSLGALKQVSKDLL